ncbi:MAG: hypothetical protein IPJ69_14985 [Deltaproteobacteria bacterium]|nr:MAG: hypothetical protein IPJ69_14985 [Deltaproteobacteria bacterium]
MKSTKVLAILMLSFLSACASNRFALRRTVPSQFDIQGIRKIAITPLEGHAYVDSYSATELTRRVEQKLQQSGLFQVMPTMSARDIVGNTSDSFDAYLVGDIRQWNVEKRNDYRREERDVTTESGTQKQTITIPILHKTSKVDYSVELISAKDRRHLGSKQYSEEKETSSEGDSIKYMTSDNDLKNDVLDKTLSRFVEDMIPHEVSYNVPWIKNDAYKAGIDLGKQGRWPEARENWSLLTKSNPNDDGALSLIGVSYEAQG